MVLRKNDIWLTVNRVWAPPTKQKKTIFFEMVLRKNGIWLTVNGVWAPPTF
jgi:hypothetical protein